MKNSHNRIKTNILIIKNKISSKSSSDDNSEMILYKQHNNYLSEIVFNSPKTLNSLNMKMIKSLLSNCGNWLPLNDKHIISEIMLDNKYSSQIPKVIIMSGVGNKSFCAGGDVVSLFHAKKAKTNFKEIAEFFR